MRDLRSGRGRRLMLAAGVAAMVIAGCGQPPPSPVGSVPPPEGLNATPRAPGQPVGSRPNVVFVLTDDLDTSLLRLMPEVQAMQARGASFTDYSLADTLCCPSRASIFTGRYPHNTGVFTNTAPDGGYEAFRDWGNQQATFATALQQAGYRTAMMGKYLNGYQPDTADPAPTGVPPGWNEWAVGGNAYGNYDYDLNVNGQTASYGDAPDDYLTDVLADRGDAFVRAQAAADQPFLLEIATYAPHGPSTPAPRHAPAFPGLTAPRGPAFNETDMTDKPTWLSSQAPLGPAKQQRIDQSYRKRAQSVQAVDDLLRRLHATLTETGQAQNTYVMFSSDNGFHLGEHRLAAGKQTAFATDVTVPLVVTGPGITPGTQVPQQTQNIDLAPTFTEMAEAPPLPDTDGRSLLPLLRGRPPGDWRHAALIEHHGPNTRPGDPDRQRRRAGNPPTYTAVKTADGTYVEYATGEREYYDDRADPAQLTNIHRTLPSDQQARLHDAALRLASCRGSVACGSVTTEP